MVRGQEHPLRRNAHFVAGKPCLVFPVQDKNSVKLAVEQAQNPADPVALVTGRR
jgi:hypothetical protein